VINVFVAIFFGCGIVSFMSNPTENTAVPVTLENFFSIAGDLPRLPTPQAATSPLRKLGPSPFPKSGFPTLGFLETVYEHIESRAKARQSPAT
jgi:hypothetical protein